MKRFKILFWAISFFCFSRIQAQTEVNILFASEDEENPESFDAAIKFIENNPSLNLKVKKIYPLYSTGNESTEIIKSLCKQVDEAFKGSDTPDIVIDFTKIGVPSEAVKVIVKSLNIPTISASYGQEGDIREWRNLEPQHEKYLIQVSPPADVLVQSVRSIVDMQNMTSAVVLFDDQFEMYHKYKALLQNMPTRHLLSKLKTSVSEQRAQINRLVHVDIVNFFIAASVAEISQVLAEASDPMAQDGPYFSDEYAWYSMSLEPGIPNCKYCKTNVSVVHLSPEFGESEKGKNRRSHLETTVSLNKLTDMFYFDLTVSAILAIGELKKKDDWKKITPPPCEDFDDTKEYEALDLDLYTEFVNSGEENILGPFVMKEKNGKNYPNFTMKIERFLFNEGMDKPYFQEDVGIWRAGFEDRELIEFKNEEEGLVSHLAHTVFRIVTVVQPPFVYWKEDCEVNASTGKYHHCFKGYCIDLLTEIQKDLKFNYTIRNVSDYGYMNNEYPHSWSGMVAELKERRADIALGAMSVMAERESVVDFTVPYYDLVGISILMRKPKATTSLFKFLTVLENDVWMCILGAYFFTSILMWIFDRWSPYSYQNNREKYEDDEEKREFNLKECLWFCMTSLTPQGGGEAPKNLSGRLVAATWWLFGFIIIASYTANLAAFLTVSRLDAPIESLDDLSKQYKVQYAPQENSSAWIYFDRMAHIEHRFYEIWKDMSLNDSMSDFERSQLAVWDYPVSDKFTKMWQAMQENTPPKTFEDAIKRVKGDDEASKESDGFAFLGEATDIKYQEITNCIFDQIGEEFSRKPYAIAGDATDVRYQTIINCGLQMVGEEFSRKPYALAVQQGSPLKDQLNDAILKLLNQRHLEQLKENWWSENPEKAECPKDDNQSDGISIHNIGGVFIVIFVGIIMACFTLIFEYWWYRKRNIAEEMAEMALPAPKEFGNNFTTEKTNFNTQYNKQPGARSDLPSIENSW